GLSDVEVDLAVIFDVAVDPVIVPERIVPTPQIAAAKAPAKTRVEEATTVKSRMPERSIGERIARVANLATIDAVPELDGHVRALGSARGGITTRLQLLGDNSRVTLELEATVVRHPSAGDHVKGLTLRRRHGLIARHRRIDLFRASGKRNGADAERDTGCKFTDTHDDFPSDGQNCR